MVLGGMRAGRGHSRNNVEPVLNPSVGKSTDITNSTTARGSTRAKMRGRGRGRGKGRGWDHNNGHYVALDFGMAKGYQQIKYIFHLTLTW